MKGNSLAVLWLGRQAFTAEGTGLIPGRRTKILQAVWHGQKKTSMNDELPYQISEQTIKVQGLKLCGLGIDKKIKSKEQLRKVCIYIYIINIIIYIIQQMVLVQHAINHVFLKKLSQILILFCIQK